MFSGPMLPIGTAWWSVEDESGAETATQRPGRKELCRRRGKSVEAAMKLFIRLVGRSWLPNCTRPVRSSSTGCHHPSLDLGTAAVEGRHSRALTVSISHHEFRHGS